MSSISRRRPIRAIRGWMYRIAPVRMRVTKSRALTQWTARSTRSKRPTTPDASAGSDTGRPAVDPPVDRVAVVLPVAHGQGADGLDPLQPLYRLVAEHPRHVEPDRPAVGPGHRLAEHRVGDDGPRLVGLLEGQGLGVHPVERPEPEPLDPGVHPGPGEEVGEADTDPVHVGDLPAGDALPVAGEMGGREPPQLVHGEGHRPAHQSPHLQAVVGRGGREPVGDRVEGPAAPARHQLAHPGALQRAEGVVDATLHAITDHPADRTETEDAEHDPTPDRLAGALPNRGLVHGSSVAPPRRYGWSFSRSSAPAGRPGCGPAPPAPRPGGQKPARPRYRCR